MADTAWAEAIGVLAPHCFKVLTPEGSGTGFLITYRKQKALCGVATAYHVVQDANEWEKPIKIVDEATHKTRILKEKERIIFRDTKADLAVVLFERKDLTVPDALLAPAPADKFVRPGIEIGWVGYPAVAPETLSFFSGRVSSFLPSQGAYLVDGVAINGVSGGPAFLAAFLGSGKELRMEVLGVVTAYIPNRATGESLPGVCFIAGIYPIHKMVQAMESFDEAIQKAAEIKESVQEDSSESPGAST